MFRIKSIKSNLSSTIKKTNSEVYKLQIAFVKKYNDVKKQIKKRNDKLDERIAEYEIELLIVLQIQCV